MKSITKDNFKETFPEFLRDLHEASFIAVDLEFTGIQREMENGMDYLQSTEEAFRGKIASASTYNPMQIGFSIFSGDGEPRDLSHASSMGGVTPCYHAAMKEEAEAFRSFNSGKGSPQFLLESIAARGVVTNEDLMELNNLRDTYVRDAQKAAENDVNENVTEAKLQNELQAFRHVDEVNEAIEVVTRWKSNMESANRCLFVRNYVCYLFPHSTETEDHTVSLSCETAQFLRRNKMDFNRWIDEGLPILPMRRYVEAKRASLLMDTKQQTNPFDTAVAALKAWAMTLNPCDTKQQLAQATESVIHFARTAEMGETRECRIPFLPPNCRTEFENLIAPLGVIIVRRVMRKLPPSTKIDKSAVDNDPSFFGVRLLEALVDATRNQRKPLVVHNGALDLAFLVCTMREVPATLVQFKQYVRDLFPIFYDTRTLTCAPSLQNISNLTGPLKRTYTTAKGLAKGVQILSSYRTSVDEVDIKEHDAAGDALMSGALFVYAQQLLTERGVDFHIMRCITTLYGCFFSLMFENDTTDCVMHLPGAPVFLIQRPPGQRMHADPLREKLSSVVSHVAFFFSSDMCLIAIEEKCTPFIKTTAFSIISEWCNSKGFQVRELNLDSRCKELGIICFHEKYAKNFPQT